MIISSSSSFFNFAAFVHTHSQPDITAPGVNVIAAYSEAVQLVDNRTTPFITESGTSMSCPHVSGVVGLLKKLHPDWSPAAIKSAIMTTGTNSINLPPLCLFLPV